ncbi:FkbM family methyltransferase [Thermomonospora cellulosilytica]|uniref:FkbM family methyltransferase n=1 Tax=Thermomonospora cellulosilytica TaxID=1411118 RepID=A0A7W3N0G1_9ACTN|nr:FkbM family methyltransferase [Thermomonospora cellulosilytica]MBA9005261.1 FkbM family methyltransferase [Thermomonospora cellulosilytica]
MSDDTPTMESGSEDPDGERDAGGAGRRRLGRGLSAVVPARLIGSFVRAVYPRLEPELARLEDFVPAGGTAVDVGGWFGPWARRLVGRADRVVTVEADPKLAGVLRRAFPQAEVVHAAASDECGQIDLWIPESGALAGISSVGGGVGRPVTVAQVTLDSLQLKDVRFIKLDIEGHELNALRGAQETIRRDLPNLLIELEERHRQMPEVLGLLRGWGYTGHVLLESGWIPLAEFDLVAHQRQTLHELDRGFVGRLLRPGRRYVNSVLFTIDPQVTESTAHN